MWVSAFIFYYWLKSFIIPSDGKKRVSYFMLPEMQKIFSNCSTENDKIRSSVFIEVIAVNYGLNDDLRDKLVSKLDPDNNDFMYTKEELFIIFKEWISSEPSAEKSPPFVPFTFTSPGFGHASTPTLPSELLRRRLPRTRLFIQGKLMCALANPNGRATDGQTRSDQSDSHYGSDDIDLDFSHSSSSTKRRLTHHRSILESKLENSERHANSLEKRYEDANSICALQKLEIERLKMELRNYHEAEQTMEEISEERRKTEMERERKCAKLQADLCLANSRINDFELLADKLRQELSQAVENCQQMENEVLYEKERFAQLQNDFTEKQLLYEDSIIKLRLMEQQVSVNDHAVSKLLEENAALTSEMNTLKDILSTYDHQHPYDNGVPLCEELPSEMLQFPVNECCSSPNESTITDNTSRLKSMSCQTEEISCLMSMQAGVMEVDSNQEELPSVSIPTESTSINTISSSQYCIADDFKEAAYSQIDVPLLKTEENCCQTDCSEMLSNFAQTELHDLFSASSQTEIYELHSRHCQSDVSYFNSADNCSQTECSEMLSNSAQTELHEVHSRHCQSDVTFLNAADNCSQTECSEMLSNSAQTELHEVHSRHCQSDVTFLNAAHNFSQTECSKMLSNSAQTKLYEVHSRHCQSDVTFLNAAHNFSQTECSKMLSNSAQTELHKVHSRHCQSDVTFLNAAHNFSQTECSKMLSNSTQTKLNNLFSAFSQTDIHELHSKHSQTEHLKIKPSLPAHIVCKRFASSVAKQFVMIVLSVLIVVISIFFLFFFVCQDNRCQLQLKYPRGPPPV